MLYTNIVYEEVDAIGILTINRPKVLNALNSKTIEEICSVLADVRQRRNIRVLVITGAGEKAFSAGADIGEIKDLRLKDGIDFFRAGNQMNNDIEKLGIPSIAAINGLALGGGFEMSMSCTLRVVSETAKMGLPELSLGVIPAYGGTQRLSRLIGKGRALWHILTGELMNGAQAVDYGLANLMVKPDELKGKTIELAKKIAEKAPLALKMALISINYGSEVEMETGLMLESALANIVIGSEDKKEGIAAFLEKRKPAYKGE